MGGYGRVDEFFERAEDDAWKPGIMCTDSANKYKCAVAAALSAATKGDGKSVWGVWHHSGGSKGNKRQTTVEGEQPRTVTRGGARTLKQGKGGVTKRDRGTHKVVCVCV